MVPTGQVGPESPRPLWPSRWPGRSFGARRRAGEPRHPRGWRWCRSHVPWPGTGSSRPPGASARACGAAREQKRAATGRWPRSAVRSATAIRSAGEAKRTPWSWRCTSAKRLAREKVARRLATVCTATPAASLRMPSARSDEQKQRQVVAVREASDPGASVVSDVALGPLAPAKGHLGQAVVLLGRPGLEGGPAPQVEHLHVGRLAPVGGREDPRPAPSCAPRWRPSAARTRP